MNAYLMTVLAAAMSASAFAGMLELDARGPDADVKRGHLKAGGVNPEGSRLDVNSLYWEKDGQPWLPVMGEFHYARYPNQYWEEELLKMKSAGLGIVATYVFWNHHEGPRDTWTWTGERDLRRFLTLCGKHGLFVWLRIGPWSHGEALHGGFPEWIQKMRGHRSDAPAYLEEVEELYRQIAAQADGLLFKHGGPIIAVQLENEFASGDPEHIHTLRRLAIDAGFDVPFYSITGNSKFFEDRGEVLPLQGAYPYRGWEKAGGVVTTDFLFATDQWIADKDIGGLPYDPDDYPRGTCEQGCGSQMRGLDRFVVAPHAVEAHACNQIGRGINLLGYYMFHGGTQASGLQEPGYPLSYDFQAPLGEYGRPAQSYAALNIAHMFVNSFGADLAPMRVVRPESPVLDPTNNTDVRYVARVRDGHGFLFINNTQPHVEMKDIDGARFRITFPEETIEFPSKPMVVAKDTCTILPLNLDMDGVVLKYATAQPLCRLEGDGCDWFFFVALEKVEPEYGFDRATVAAMDGPSAESEKEDRVALVTAHVGRAHALHVIGVNGRKVGIVTLSRAEAEQCRAGVAWGRERVVICDADLIFTGDAVEFRRVAESQMRADVFPPVEGGLRMGDAVIEPTKSGIFQRYDIALDAHSVDVSVDKISDGEWRVGVGSPAQPVNDVFLDVDYVGDRAEALIDGRVVADDLYNGRVWRIGLKRFMPLGNDAPMVIRAHPWNPKVRGITLPPDAPQGDAERISLIRTVGVVPEYRALLSR